ncbi:MAG: hypothetical protein GMKNLPBB_00421 [Myxococcota bacterium]|nr:hypothetical protein [Myxococcota bacterium]
MSEFVSSFLNAHEQLREKFARHRDWVVGLEFHRALEALDEFERDLLKHMQDEERSILPLYESRVGRVPGGAPELFRLEHKNLLRNLEVIREALRRLADDPSAGRRRAHEFLHQEGVFMHLLEHHDLRERNILYPRLEEKLSAGEIREVLDACGLAP